MITVDKVQESLFSRMALTCDEKLFALELFGRLIDHLQADGAWERALRAGVSPRAVPVGYALMLAMVEQTHQNVSSKARRCRPADQ